MTLEVRRHLGNVVEMSPISPMTAVSLASGMAPFQSWGGGISLRVQLPVRRAVCVAPMQQARETLRVLQRGSTSPHLPSWMPPRLGIWGHNPHPQPSASPNTALKPILSSLPPPKWCSGSKEASPPPYALGGSKVLL